MCIEHGKYNEYFLSVSVMISFLLNPVSAVRPLQKTATKNDETIALCVINCNHILL